MKQIRTRRYAQVDNSLPGYKGPEEEPLGEAIEHLSRVVKQIHHHLVYKEISDLLEEFGKQVNLITKKYNYPLW
jgi:hypothetical protein